MKKVDENKRVLIFLGLCLSLHFTAPAAETPKVGIVAVWNFTKQGRESAYQQKVWEYLLGRYRMFQAEVLSEEVLTVPDKLRAYRVVVVPATRQALTREQLTNLIDYVAGGGKLLRDQGALQFVGELSAKGWRYDRSAESVAMVKEFWRTVGGIADVSNLTMTVESIRVCPTGDVLSEFLPTNFTPVEASRDADARWMREVFGYQLTGAQPILEAQVVELGSNAPPLAIATRHVYGKGECVCLGINVRGLGGLKNQMVMYRDFFANLAFWLVESKN